VYHVIFSLKHSHNQRVSNF